MTDSMGQNFIKEIIFCIKESDLVKAKALVQYFSDVEPKIQMRVLYELSKSPDEIAYPVFDYLYGVEGVLDNIKDKIYNCLLEISYGNTGLVVDYMQKKDSGNRTTYIKIAGELKQESTVNSLIDILNTETDIHIIEETARTLGAIGSKECVTALTAFLHSDDLVLKNTGISALAEIGDEEAIEKLAAAVSGDNKSDPFIIEGLAGIQDNLSMSRLSEMLASPFANIRSMVIDSLIKIGPKAVPGLMAQLKSEDADSQVHALTILGKIGDASAISGIQKLLYKKPENSNVRFGAYEALGRLPSSKSAISLAIGLEDPDEQVRMAAAKAIDKNLSDVLVAGLKNLIKSGDEDAKGIVSVFIESGADNVFDNLIEWDDFTNIATDYLANKAHPDIRAHCLTLLNEKGKSSLVEKIEQSSRKEAKGEGVRLYVVDDSKMMLRLYSKKLHDMGYVPITFQYPEEALKKVIESQPHLLITDLNMPKINGLQLTNEIRRNFDLKQLPIIMITTQSDFVGGENEGEKASVSTDAMLSSGVNEVLHKPFRDEELAALIKKYIAGKK